MMPAVQDNQIKAMLALLTDPDERTVDLVKQTLVNIGLDAVPSLLKAGEMADSKAREELRSILEEIRLNHLESRFHHWAFAVKDGEPDLEEGAFCWPSSVILTFLSRPTAEGLMKWLRSWAHTFTE